MQINRKVRPEILDSVALLVIDAQDSFIDTLSHKEEFKKRVAFAIEAARCLKLNTIFTEQAPEKLGRTNSDLFKLALNPKVFSKQSFSALGAPGIERFIRDKEIYHLLVVGLEVPICVYQTGLQATDEDIDITFLSDCLGSRRTEDESTVLATLTRMGCQVLPSEAIFYSLLADTQNAYFRPFTEIVKAFGSSDFSLETYLKNRPQVQDIPDRPERPQRPPREERPQRAERSQKDERPPRDRDDFREPRDDSESEERPQRQPENRGEGRTDERRSDRTEEESERRRGRNRNRRRGRNRNRDNSDASPESKPSNSSEDRPNREERPNREDRPRREDKPKRENQIEKPPAPAKPEATAPRNAEPTENPPAKKAAKKTTKKVAKKAAKKVAKKAAKKIAKKTTKTPHAE